MTLIGHRKEKTMFINQNYIGMEDARGSERIYAELQNLNKNYPDFYNWYHEKVIPDPNRKILVLSEGQKIAGVLITKDGFEKKICTLRVNKKYRHKGLGSYLMKQSFNLLNTDKPIITVSENHLFEFNPLLRRFGFDLKRIYHNYYMIGKNEYSFNGYLVDNESKKGIAL